MPINSGKVTATEGAGGLCHAAVRVAAEVEQANRCGQKKLTKVTSLMHAFRGDDTSGLDDVVAELHKLKVHVDSGWEVSGRSDIHRTGVLELSTDTTHVEVLSSEHDDTIRMSTWSRTEAGCEGPLPKGLESAQPGVVRWFDVDPIRQETSAASVAKVNEEVRAQRRGRRIAGAPENKASLSRRHNSKAAFEQRVDHLWQSLQPRCPGLNREMVSDLVWPDLQPKVEIYGDEKEGVRSVSAAAVIAREVPGRGDDSDGVSEELVFQLVEMLVGEGWLLTCWHSSRIFRGSSEDEPGPHILRETFNSHVRHRWRSEGKHPREGKSSGDLGLALARSLVDTYGASYRMIERWVESWEVNFFKSLSSQPDKASVLKEAATEISNSLSMVAEFRRRISALEHARWATSDRCWFPRLTDHGTSGVKEEDRSTQAKALEASIYAAEEKLKRLSDDIRADMDLLMLQSAGNQQAISEALQNRLGLVTGLVLVPTLVAGVYGANTQLPGRDSWIGFAMMIVGMILSGIAVYLPLRGVAKTYPPSSSRRSNRGSS